MNRPNLVPVMLCFILLTVFVGCSKTVTIKTAANVYEGRITTSDDESVTVVGPQGLQDINRSEIVEIDHPGNIQMVAGYGIATISGLFVAAGLAFLATGDLYTQIAGLAVLLPSVPAFAISLPIGIWGHVTWNESKGAISDAPPSLEKPKTKQPRLVVVPFFDAKDEESKTGFRFEATF